MNKTRSCVSCRARGKKGELIKLSDTPAGVVVDYNERLPGRGAYVCFDGACMDKALKGGQLQRAFRRNVKLPGKEEFLAELRAKVAAKVESLLGMARKSGQAVMGFDAALEAMSKMPDGLLILAEDVSENTLRKLSEANPAAFDKAVRLKTKEELGMVLGVKPVGVLYMPATGLAEALEREIGRLIKISGG